jgi:hypothetical protein
MQWSGLAWISNISPRGFLNISALDKLSIKIAFVMENKRLQLTIIILLAGGEESVCII